MAMRASISVDKSSPPLGEGRFGIVYRATNTSTGEQIAAKVCLSPENDPQFGERMCAREWKMLVKVQGPKGEGHPNVLYLIGRLDATTIALQLAPAGDLLDLLQKYVNNGIPGKLAEPILRGIMSGLEFLHTTCGVMHGDLKPENIAMKDATTPLLADFDAATEIGTRLPFLRGTEEYIPPEWCSGAGKSKQSAQHIAAASADMWSAGMVAIVLLTGVHAWNITPPPSSARVMFGNPDSRSQIFWRWRDEQAQRAGDVACGTAAAPADPWDRLLAASSAARLVLAILTVPKPDIRLTASEALETIGSYGVFAEDLESVNAKKIKRCKKERNSGKIGKVASLKTKGRVTDETPKEIGNGSQSLNNNNERRRGGIAKFLGLATQCLKRKEKSVPCDALANVTEV